MALCALSANAGYGILVNGNTLFEGEDKGENDEGYYEYKASVTVKKGDYCQLINTDTDETWVVDLNTYSEKGFTRNNDKIDISVTGCYDFYIQLKWKEDRLYIGPGSNCGEGTPYGQSTAKFYVTGTENLLAGSGKAAWDPAALPSEADSYVLHLAKGDYKLKITTNGKWGTGKGYSDLTAKPKGLSKDADNNICFTLEGTEDVMVTYTADPKVFTVSGNFYIKPLTTEQLRLVPSEEWADASAQFAAWIWGEETEGQWTEFFVPVSKGNDTLYAEIPSNADSVLFVRFSPKAAEPAWYESGASQEVLEWGRMSEQLIDHTSLVWTVIGWTEGQWTPYDKPCENYGLMINGVYKPAKKNVLQTEWTEYMLRNLKLKAGDKVQIHDKCNDATWIMEKFAATSFTFEIKKDGEAKYYYVAQDGEYDFYIKFIFENDEVYVSKKGTYTTAVRDQCTDVLMQAFYNESYSDDAPGVSATKDYKLGLGNTRWATLLPQADEIGHYFDLIWLPPSAEGDGMGYHPKNYCNQNSNWGTRAELEALIAALHNAGAKVVADIVINHCTGYSSWCDFPEFNFGEYGVFHPDASYICRNDEVNADWAKEGAGDCWGKASGSYDDGENWDGARDWSHDNVYVQDMFKAYLLWMRNVMKYDGFRYDKGDGFNNWHHDNYNKTAGPYIAFMESYNGTDRIQEEITQANGNLMGLDFDLKWHVFNSFAGWDYGRGRGDCIMSRGDGRHAVTFIESHDWFLRPDNENEFGGRGNSLTPALKARLLQANAFLLSMPGVPCVFYPHWKKYKEELKPMIEARKFAGVHSESGVWDEYSNSTGYQATIGGKYGYLILCLGDKANKQGFDGYTLMSSYYSTQEGHNESYEIWVNRTAPLGVEETESEQPVIKAEKVFLNGQLYIMYNGTMYNVQGQKIY